MKHMKIQIGSRLPNFPSIQPAPISRCLQPITVYNEAHSARLGSSIKMITGWAIFKISAYNSGKMIYWVGGQPLIF